MPLSDLDAAAARAGLDQYKSKLSAATTDEAKAEAEVGVEVHEAIIAALGN